MFLLLLLFVCLFVLLLLLLCWPVSRHISQCVKVLCCFGCFVTPHSLSFRVSCFNRDVYVVLDCKVLLPKAWGRPLQMLGIIVIIVIK